MGKFNLSVVGLGKLGVCTAACFVYKGYKVLGLDINKKTINLVNQSKAPVIEPRLQELLDKSRSNFRATTDSKKIIKNSDITFFIVPTPSKKDHSFSDECLKAALKPLAQDLKNKKAYHLFVIVSTVSPGTIEKKLIPLIEKYSAKKLNKDFGVCYNPEFIALGDVINGLLKPDMVLIGESDKRAGDKLEAIYKRVCENKPYIARMSIISAEIAKISLNVYVTMKITFANTLGRVCEKIEGAEIDKITAALGADKRVSPYFLKAGLSYAGPCFPRDNRAFYIFAKNCGVDALLSKATDYLNRFYVQYTTEKILKLVKNSKNKAVSILGLAYKVNTPEIEESVSIEIIRRLLLENKNIKISVYDPLAMENVRKIFGERIHYASLIDHCLSQSALWVIAQPHPEFKKIHHLHKKHLKKQKRITIIDFWRHLEPKKLHRKVRHLRTGHFHGEINGNRNRKS